jgi:hypothetical protein
VAQRVGSKIHSSVPALHGLPPDARFAIGEGWKDFSRQKD